MLYNEINYTSDISYLNNVFIYEYDISKANINVLYSKGAIDKNTYDYLYAANRDIRQVYIGKLQKENKEIVNILKAGIIEAKKCLFEANNIQDYEVLSIKNDAVFIINRQLQNTQFGLINFKCKNKYTSFYKFNNLEVYYFYDSFSKNEVIEVKGISETMAEKYWNKKCSCGNKLNPDEIAMNYKLFGRYEDIKAEDDDRELLCKECLCEKLGITTKEYSEKVQEFRSQGCNLF